MITPIFDRGEHCRFTSIIQHVENFAELSDLMIAEITPRTQNIAQCSNFVKTYCISED